MQRLCVAMGGDAQTVSGLCGLGDLVLTCTGDLSRNRRFGLALGAGKTLDETRAASRATIPAGRYGTIEEFGAVAAFLASTQASYVTGSVIRCDGGSIKSV